MATKKTPRKTAAAAAAALPQPADIPAGMKQLGGGYAPTWDPKEGEVIHGPTTGLVKEVEMVIGRKKQVRRCVEVTDQYTGVRVTLWESAALGELFDHLAESGPGTVIYVRFDGLGKAKKAGQHPPKLYTVALAA